MILNQTSEWTVIRWHNILEVSVCNILGFCTSQVTLWEVTVHLVTIKVGIVSVTVGVVHPNSSLVSIVKDPNTVGHDAWFVQCWLMTDWTLGENQHDKLIRIKHSNAVLSMAMRALLSEANSHQCDGHNPSFLCRSGA